MNNPDPRVAIDQVTATPYDKLVHDLNNLLMVISCTSTAMLSRCPEDDPNRTAVKIILDASLEAADLGRQLRQHNPEQSGAIDRTDLRPHQATTDRPTILLVDDEPQLLHLVKKALQPKGYEILEARHGPAAIATALRYQGPIQLLITDLQMPDMNGDELAATLRREMPEMSVLYISGQDGQPAAECNGTRKTDSFLQKPFTMTDLITRVTALIGSPRLPMPS